MIYDNDTSNLSLDALYDYLGGKVITLVYLKIAYWKLLVKWAPHCIIFRGTHVLTFFFTNSSVSSVFILILALDDKKRRNPTFVFDGTVVLWKVCLPLENCQRTRVNTKKNCKNIVIWNNIIIVYKFLCEVALHLYLFCYFICVSTSNTGVCVCFCRMTQDKLKIDRKCQQGWEDSLRTS